MKKSIYIGLCTMLLMSVIGCQAESTSQTNSTKGTAMTESITELQKIDTQVGTGREAEPGFNVTVHYTGWLYDPSAEDKKGTKFDSSVDRGQPFNFFLGGGQVIQGWDEGFAGMKVGGKRTLIIPPEMGYGARGAGGVIPPNATLVFDVELLDVK
jgi:FKBP-type peptidyl-prolyl cis-trans isomerase FkpA